MERQHRVAKGLGPLSVRAAWKPDGITHSNRAFPLAHDRRCVLSWNCTRPVLAQCGTRCALGVPCGCAPGNMHMLQLWLGFCARDQGN